MGNLNSTLNRPMASQSGTRYEDRTMQRGASSGAGGSGDRSGSGGAIAAHMNNSAAGYMPEEVQMQNMSLYGGNQAMYAQVNRDKKKNSRNHSENPQMMMHYSDYSEHADHWQQQQQPPPQHIHGPAATPAGDSWV